MAGSHTAIVSRPLSHALPKILYGWQPYGHMTGWDYMAMWLGIIIWLYGWQPYKIVSRPLSHALLKNLYGWPYGWNCVPRIGAKTKSPDNFPIFCYFIFTMKNPTMFLKNHMKLQLFHHHIVPKHDCLHILIQFNSVFFFNPFFSHNPHTTLKFPESVTSLGLGLCETDLT